MNGKLRKTADGKRIYGDSVHKNFMDWGEVYIAGFGSSLDKGRIDDPTFEELQDGSFWVGGNSGELVSDSNVKYSSCDEFENYLKRYYQFYAVFCSDSDRDEWAEAFVLGVQMGLEHGKKAGKEEKDV